MRQFVRSVMLQVMLMGCLSACTHSESAQKNTEPVSSAGKSADNKAASCDDASIMCTMEFAPHVCTFAEKKFEASNRCQATRLARRYACEQRLAFAEDKVVCTPQMQMEVKQACEGRKVCTREYKPHVCHAMGKQYEGPNRCEALNAARVAACEAGEAIDEARIHCQPIKSKKIP